MTAEEWIEILNSHPYKEQLFANDPIFIQINNGTESFVIQIQKEEAAIYANHDFGINIHCKLSGNEWSLKKLLYGEIKLQDALEKAEVHLEASFRNLLWLETLLWMNKSNPKLNA